MSNKRICQITVSGGKSVKFNNSIVPNNSMGGTLFKTNNSTVQKVSSIFVFFSAVAIFYSTRSQGVTAYIVTAFYMYEKTGNFPFLNGHLKFY